MRSSTRKLLCLVLLALLARAPGLAVARQGQRPELASSVVARASADLQRARTSLRAGIDRPGASSTAALRRYTRDVDAVVRSLDRQIIRELGPPRDPVTRRPVAFELFSMGSYCRSELAPYSDLDYGVLVERLSPAVRDYFSRYAARLGELLHAVDPSPHGLRPCEGMSPAGQYGAFVLDTPAGMAARLSGRSPDLAAQPPRTREYVQSAISNTRRVSSRGRRGLHRQFVVQTFLELGPIDPAPGPARRALIDSLRPSLRDPFGVPAGAADPAWAAGMRVPPPKDPATAIGSGDVNIKHDILRAFQTPILMLRDRYGVAANDTVGILRELGREGRLEASFAAELRRAYRDAQRLRTRRHLEAATSDDRLGALSHQDQQAVRRMVPLLIRLRREAERL